MGNVTSYAGPAGRVKPRLSQDALRGLWPVLAMPVLAAAGGAVVVANPRLVHALLAVLVAGALVLVALWSPRHAVFVLFALLPFLALGRRLLISYDGWHSAEPLLLVAPTVAIALLVLRGRARPVSRLSVLVLALLGWSMLEVLNPLGGGLIAGTVGLLFVAVPLLWFFVGRDLIDRRSVSGLIALVLAVSTVVALYGIIQSTAGLPRWDKAWVEVAGYGALNVAGTIRAFGTFASSAEYVSYLALAIVASVALALHRRVMLLAVVPLLATALFLDASRGIVVLTVATVVILVGLRLRRFGASIVVVAVLAAGVIFAVRSFESTLVARADTSGNPLVQHQVEGLTDPLDEEKSTLRIHWRLFTNGVADSFSRPLGAGPAATNRAGSRFGGTVAPTEVDASNAFVGLGIPGGVLFLLIVFTVLRRVVSLYRLRRDPLLLVVSGILFVMLGHWLNGGFYAVSPLVWLLIGWTEREWVDAQAGRGELADG